MKGVHFPHILDAIFDCLPAEALVSASQVCQPWRGLVKNMFYHVVAMGQADDHRFVLRSGRSFGWKELLDKARTNLLLRLCVIFEEADSEFYFWSKWMGHACAWMWLSLKLVRARWSDGDIQTVMHVSRSATPTHRRDSCSDRCHTWRDVSRVVHTVSAFHWSPFNYFDLNLDLARFPIQLNSVTWVYPLMADPSTGYHSFTPADIHLMSFGDVVVNAWSRKKTVTVVNAASLDGRSSDLEILRPVRGELIRILSEDDFRHEEYYQCEGLDAEEILRRVAILAATDHGYMAPGPVCPVHFVTLEEYRAQVGELEYVIDTEKDWIPSRTELF